MIIFKKLTFANFLSVGNQPVTINLDQSKTTLVHGSNGSGKSTILDALTYVLFNKPFRRVNLSQLINTQNKKGLYVEVEFNIGKDTFLICRGMKPKTFDIFKNKKLIDSKAADKDNQSYLEQNILKLNYKSFTQIVILGSSNFIPFMQLSTSGRREVVEDFLDIKIFSVMSIMAKERLRGLKEQYRILEADIDAYEFRLQGAEEQVEFIRKCDDDLIEELKGKIRDADAEMFNLQQQLDQWSTDILTHEDIIKSVAITYPKENAKKYNDVVIRLNAKLERLIQAREFYQENATCHTCNQDISYEHAQIELIVIKEQMNKVDDASIQARHLCNQHTENEKQLCNLNIQMDKFERSIFELNTQMNAQKIIKDQSERKIQGIEDNREILEDKESSVLQLQQLIYEMKDRKRKIYDDIKHHDIVVNLLKDSGIKTQVVRKYLPAMNKFIRQYLTQLDLPLHFVLDQEFNESVSSPLHQDFSYQSFSEGQKGRIDLALMLTWREIAKLKNTVATNILILDEVFSSSLDDTGKEYLLQILRYRLPDNQSVVVVDHTLSESFKDKFDRSIEVTRTNGFSKYN